MSQDLYRPPLEHVSVPLVSAAPNPHPARTVPTMNVNTMAKALSSHLPSASSATKTRLSLLSLALCDALGGPAEFHQRGTFPHITTMQPNTNFNLPPGTWTDDTSMALCLARSITSGTFSEADQARIYLQWYTHGYLSATNTCFDIGAATRAALDIWRSGRGLPEVARSLDKKVRCGNGSLMRVLPVALAYWSASEERLSELARRSSLVTHPHKMCQEACALYVNLVAAVVRAADAGAVLEKRDLLERVMAWEYESSELSDVLSDGAFVRKEEAAIRSSGYVVHTLEAALWTFFRTESFEEGAIRVVNLGDDADTVAAVYGGLAGAWYGQEDDEGNTFWSERVKGWRTDLVKRKVVESIAEELVGLGVNAGGK